MQKKFYFEPIRVEKGKDNDGFYPFCRISKAGLLSFANATLTYLGIGNQKAILRIFGDTKRRAFGFKIVNLAGKKEDGYRVLVPRQTAGGAWQAGISIKSFLKKLNDVELPSPRLKIDVYEDKDGYLSIGEVYYIEIPENKKSKKDPSEC